MNRAVFEWLGMPFEGPSIPGVETPTRLQVWAMLVYRNGGRLQANGWGVLTSKGPYGWMGLEAEEAHLLNDISAFVCGAIYPLAIRDVPEINDPLQAEWDRVAALIDGEKERS